MVGRAMLRLLGHLALLALALGASPKPQVKLYMETLCPYCAHFVESGLSFLFTSGLSEEIQLELIPWGNARRDHDGKNHCQHGPVECTMNQLLQCVVHYYPEQDAFFPYANCTETSVSSLTAQRRAQECAEALGMDWAKITTCATGKLGAELDTAAYEATAALIPQHQYVPWVTVNGMPLEDSYADVARYICLLLDEPRPKACWELSGSARRGALGASAAALTTLLQRTRGAHHLILLLALAALGAITFHGISRWRHARERSAAPLGLS